MSLVRLVCRYGLGSFEAGVGDDVPGCAYHRGCMVIEGVTP